jgi:hypothetical protein
VYRSALSIALTAAATDTARPCTGQSVDPAFFHRFFKSLGTHLKINMTAAKIPLVYWHNIYQSARPAVRLDRTADILEGK